MVLQRESAVPIWGTAVAGEKITLTLNDQTVQATADSQGKWSTAFKNLAAGGPFSLTIKGDKSTPVTIADVAVGDVWLCAGQSNMSLPIAAVTNFDPEVMISATDPLIRCYTGSYLISPTPVVEPGNGATTDNAVPQGGDITTSRELAAQWKRTTPTTIPGFTAMGYYFARELRRELGIPIGIVHISYGGSSIEAWTSREGLATLGLAGKVDDLLKIWDGAETLGAKYLTTDFAAWEAKNGRADTSTEGTTAGWANRNFPATDWSTLQALGDWKTLNIPNGGIIWARKEINLPSGVKGKELSLDLGNLHNADANYGNVTGTIYFNGTEVSRLGYKIQHPFSQSDDATATIPGALVKSGTNVLALRIVDQNATGAIYGSDKFKIGPHINSKTWADPWKVKVEAAFPALPAGALASRPVAPPVIPTVQVPTLLYNGMLSPAIPYGIKGVLWDHGTADAYVLKGKAIYDDRGGNYGKLLKALIQDWRTRWNNQSLPFVFTQHPNWGGASIQPTTSYLGPVREGELLTWKTTPNTYMAVTVGLVAADDNIHYKNKKEAARRLSLAALAGVYGRNIEYSGPVYDSMTIEGNKVRIKFTHLGGGLVAKDGPLKTFAIAGADKKFVWGNAVIDGDDVVVSSAQIPNPLAVRYAWADNPAGPNLYNKTDLPAPTFRTDDWSSLIR
jgi:sialate O-acetylesterase